ncbi:MAG: hypothetical protein ACKN9T_13085 [Candidatus Methylumidiphilus sp.]
MSKKLNHWPKGRASGDSIATLQNILDDLRRFFALRKTGSVKVLHINIDTKQFKPLITVAYKRAFARYDNLIDLGTGRNGEMWQGVALHGYNVRWAIPAQPQPAHAQTPSCAPALRGEVPPDIVPQLIAQRPANDDRAKGRTEKKLRLFPVGISVVFNGTDLEQSLRNVAGWRHTFQTTPN